ncbi:MAG: hypothetical protein NTX82_04825 [Candidatus Parcubacteria bacterium]|nr:hypothetical protein [Candidatus Parcubacteria bacterium]
MEVTDGKIVISYPGADNQVFYQLFEDLKAARPFMADHPGSHFVIDEKERAKALNRAVKVSYSSMKKPGLLAVNDRWKPFTPKEIEKLTSKVKTYALTDDGDHLFMWGE